LEEKGMIDRRKETVEEIGKKIAAGERLTADEMKKYLYLARDFSLLYLTRESVSGKTVKKARLSLFNVLQNAVERYELNNDAGNNPAATMEAVWQRAMDRAVASNQS
jgi:hypothetical protein